MKKNFKRREEIYQKVKYIKYNKWFKGVFR